VNGCGLRSARGRHHGHPSTRQKTCPGGVVTAELFSDGGWSATVRGEDCGYLAQALEQL
jgi:hypothetical protein